MQIAREALAQTTGWNPAQLPALQLPASTASAVTHTAGNATASALQPLPYWLDLAAQNNLQILRQGG